MASLPETMWQTKVSVPVSRHWTWRRASQQIPGVNTQTADLSTVTRLTAWPWAHRFVGHNQSHYYVYLYITSPSTVADFVHCGCLLKDDLPLDFYGIKCGSTLHVIKRMWPEPEVKSGMFGAELILRATLDLISAKDTKIWCESVNWNISPDVTQSRWTDLRLPGNFGCCKQRCTRMQRTEMRYSSLMFSFLSNRFIYPHVIPKILDYEQ